MTWTRFMDMHSGGGQKLEWARVLIEAPEAEARIAFERLLGRDPDNVTCECCGEDYSVDSEESLEELTSYDRERRGRVQPLDKYLAGPDVKVIRAAELGSGSAETGGA